MFVFSRQYLQSIWKLCAVIMSLLPIINEVVSIILPTETFNNFQNETFNRKPFIIRDCCDKHDRIIQLENKKHEVIVDRFPGIDEFINNTNNIFGNFNEIEYSTNVFFKNLTINYPPNTHVNKHIRYYFNHYTRIYINNNILSTDYMIDSNCVDVKIITRVDYATDDVNCALDDISVKLKLIKKDFRYNDVSYRLTGSLEIPMNEFKPILLDRYSRKRRIDHWMLAMTHRGKYLVFRVAFRKENFNGNDYTCNIECESRIEPASFIECSDLLYKYYKQQYIMNNDAIQPIVDYIRIPLLTTEQKKTLKTLTFLDSRTACTESDVKVDARVADLIKYLGVRAFMGYVPENHKARLPAQIIKFDNLMYADKNMDNYIDFDKCNVTFDDI